LLAAAAGTAGGLALDGTAMLKKVDRNLEPESYEMYRKLINVEPDGTKKEFILFSVKKGRDKVAALFSSRPATRAAATLRQGDNMWLYIPNVGKPVRITSLQSVTGGVFNNADILRVDYTEEYDVQLGRGTGRRYVLTLKAKTGDVAYDKLVMRWTRSWCCPRRSKPLPPAACWSRRCASRTSRTLAAASSARHGGNRQPAVQGLPVGDAVFAAQEARSTRRGVHA
jgi:outer membrane lipoprotein-sorting protein